MFAIKFLFPCTLISKRLTRLVQSKVLCSLVFATESFVNYIISTRYYTSISVCIIISLILNCWKRKSFFTFNSRKSRTSISSSIYFFFYSSSRLCSLQVISFGFRISWWTIKIKKFIIICSFYGGGASFMMWICVEGSGGFFYIDFDDIIAYTQKTMWIKGASGA